jgi:hypothetical protein
MRFHSDLTIKLTGVEHFCQQGIWIVFFVSYF